ncbi:DUF4388 domain-containing protein, partial [Myxococcota bacterium]|nr:DUF4388 domain-containing protein [Myxococcota bacterium]
MPRSSLLLVDPDVRSSRVLEVSLRKAGFIVQTAASATDALTSALRNPPDLVITETALPDVDGFELCMRLRRDPRTGDSAVLFLSTDTSADTKVASINAGGDDYLTKPALVMEIVNRVRGLLERRETERIARRERSGNLSGQLAHMGVVDLLQLMETGAKSGIVHLASDAAKSGGLVGQGEQRGTIYFRDGRVIDAHLGRLAGAPAVYRMLMWSDGIFELELKPLAREDVVQSTTQALLLEGMRRVDEWSRAAELLPPLTAQLAADFAVLGARYRELPEHLRAIAPLFDGRRTILDVVDEAGIDDLDALRAVLELYQAGVLRPGDRAAPAADASAVEAWLAGASNIRPTTADLPSIFARATIPSPASASEILRAADPRATLDPTEPTLDGTLEQPIPLTTPVRERTPAPEPMADDSVVLSRHTVPANRAVLLTSSKPGPADLTPQLVPSEPIPLTQPVQRPRLVVQRMTSTPGRPPSIIEARESVAQALDPSSPTLESWSPATSAAPTTAGAVGGEDPTVQDFSTLQIRTVSPATRAQSAVLAGAPGSSLPGIPAAKTSPNASLPGVAIPGVAPSAGLPGIPAAKTSPSASLPGVAIPGVAPNIPAAKTSPNASLPGVASAGSSLPGVALTDLGPSGSLPGIPAAKTSPAIAVTIPVATTSPKLTAPEPSASAWPVQGVPRSLALDETERVVRTRSADRAPAQSPALIVAARTGDVPPSAADAITARPASATRELSAAASESPTLTGVASPIDAQRDAPAIVAAVASDVTLPPTPARMIDAAPAVAREPAPDLTEKRPIPVAARSDDELQDAFFSKAPEEEVPWEGGNSSRWKGVALIALLVGVAGAAIVAPGLVDQKVEKAPLPAAKKAAEPEKKAAEPEKKAAAWPKTDETGLQIGTSTAAQTAQGAATAAQPTPATAQPTTTAPTG